MNKKKNITLCFLAILDLDVHEQVVPTIRTNIIDANLDFYFTVMVNIDNYQRHGCRGTALEIENCYKQLETGNCTVKIVAHPDRRGVNLSYIDLCERFINSDSEYCIYFDDDHEIINPVVFDDFYHILNDDEIYHLAAGRKEGQKTFSHENIFLQDKILHDLKTVVVYENDRSFHTQPGTIISKKQASIVLQQLSPSVFSGHEKESIEDLVGKTKFFRSSHVHTIFYKTDDMKLDFSAKTEGWVLPLKNHFAYDRIRASSGQSGANLRDFNN